MRSSAHRLCFTAGCLLLAGALAACSPSASLTSPSVAGTPDGSPSGATIFGSVDARSAGSPAPLASGASLTGPLGLLQVTVVGTGITATLDETGSFLLVNVPSGTVQLLFTGNGVNATTTLQNVGAQDYIQIQVALAGGDSVTIVGEERSAATMAICHLTGTGRFELVHINPSAEAGHRGHGDGLPGEPVPGAVPAATFGPNCEAPLVERPIREEDDEEEEEDEDEEELEDDGEDTSERDRDSEAILVHLCHRTGNGRFILITVDVHAQPAHMAHGDGLPNGPVPGSSGLTFGPACEVPASSSSG